jgi:AcrR family transcriptional regulator
MGLFATIPIDEVTVQDIASAVEMTPAAVYYHFASKEQILLEGMTRFGEGLLAQVRGHLDETTGATTVSDLLGRLLSWAGGHRTDATVYLVASIGLNLQVEALRRENRIVLVELFGDAVRAARGRLGAAEAGVIAVALVSLLETALASMLNEDAAYRSLGTQRFPAQVGALGDRIAGLGD